MSLIHLEQFAQAFITSFGRPAYAEAPKCLVHKRAGRDGIACRFFPASPILLAHT